jgi:hypothetical protein
VFAAPQEPHQRRTRDPAYAGGTAFGAGDHGNHESQEKNNSTYLSRYQPHAQYVSAHNAPTDRRLHGSGNACVFGNY